MNRQKTDMLEKTQESRFTVLLRIMYNLKLRESSFRELFIYYFEVIN